MSIREADLNSKATVTTLRAMFDNFEIDSTKPETTNAAKDKEINAFLEAVLATQVIQDLMNFFKSKRE